ncbi:NADH dehydrogenase [ubiquinone] 1 alpha subcomplex subunit 10, mitochondrial-like [Lingula anatina]|uniref:NADH dehydrogenase [ubiquinone] 1 alpha subcomplex subunit 10, mitochondrial-like n=1 Tax=Lingula anatina TaxID=7574 RepID=A0A1S3K114_LINAN|nr:NADH dehydrogenase [ubiquinone] 1 alpha subcomplex subunit 10, mitochondrial-like [Lingula anatina]|eukprot:XP_013416222.1 NADH dehydrogenase [ubiquinone] 1 alpha subcomplex subunit 10, mitochondrial-like [Lingula anatina]
MALTKGLLLRSLSVAGFQSTKLTSQLVVPATPLVVQAATITRGPKKWPKYPFPYKRLRYRMCYRLFWRGNGNLVPNESKVIVVDGNAAVGKSEFAKELAERLDFKMFDEPEELFSRYYTWAGQPDDPKAMSPKDAQTYHFPQFFSDPGRNRGACIGLQLELFKLRYFHYCKALNHLYSTGQGVVLVRSPFSDRAFVETYFDLGLLPGADCKY